MHTQNRIPNINCPCDQVATTGLYQHALSIFRHRVGAVSGVLIAPMTLTRKGFMVVFHGISVPIFRGRPPIALA